MCPTLEIVFYHTGHDALERHNNMQFTTFDADNDKWRANCAANYGNGGNWYYDCHQQNMNGKYGAGGDAGGEYMSWLNFDTNNSNMALKSMRWMLREVV